MWYKNIAGRFFGLVTKHACDRQTERWTGGQNYDSQDRAGIAASCGKNRQHKPVRRKLVRQDDGRLLTSTGVIRYAPLHCWSSTEFNQIYINCDYPNMHFHSSGRLPGEPGSAGSTLVFFIHFFWNRMTFRDKWHRFPNGQMPSCHPVTIETKINTQTSGYATMVHGRGCNPHRCTTTFTKMEITSLWRHWWRHNSETIRDRQKTETTSCRENRIALRQLLQNRKLRHLWRHNLGSRRKLQKMAWEYFSIGAFYNITKNQHNLIKTVGRDSFLSPKTPKNTSF